jgi:hypothetical protein
MVHKIERNREENKKIMFVLTIEEYVGSGMALFVLLPLHPVWPRPAFHCQPLPRPAEPRPPIPRAGCVVSRLGTAAEHPVTQPCLV